MGFPRLFEIGRLALISLITVTSVAAALGDRPVERQSTEDYATMRARMIQAIEEDVRLTRREIGKSELELKVLKAMDEVPRHAFVPEAQLPFAYDNRPLPIGHGQTISQPYIVALMTDLMNVDQDSVVLEVGTGSGYQAAVLAELVRAVYTMEIVEPLGEQARERLERLGYDNVAVKVGDGYYGWEGHAPYDAIIVTAAASHVPPPLIAQLKPGGRMIIPVGPRFYTQQLLLVEKDADGEVTSRQILPVAFVPLTGGH
jgi:protein-L-isoaspartate(D-aspartate) O-methyltransferase